MDEVEWSEPRLGRRGKPDLGETAGSYQLADCAGRGPQHVRRFVLVEQQRGELAHAEPLARAAVDGQGCHVSR